VSVTERALSMTDGLDNEAALEMLCSAHQFDRHLPGRELCRCGVSMARHAVHLAIVINSTFREQGRWATRVGRGS
jgi:hypothetical protein